MKKNKFDLSHEKRLTCKQGYLIPTMIIQTLPGASYRFKSQNFTRLAPMVAPPMQRIDVRTYNFFVPERIIWDDSEEFHTRGRNQDSTVTVPRVLINQTTRSYFEQGSLGDYLGIPPTDRKIMADGSIDVIPTMGSGHYVSALPFRAYWAIVNEIFRNQEVEAENEFSKSSADVTATLDIAALCTLALRNYDKDYFTSGKLSANLNAELNGYARVEPIEDGVSELYKDISIVRNEDGEFATPASTLGHNSVGGLLNEVPEFVRIENINDPLGVSIAEIQRVSAMRRWMLKIIQVGYRYVDYLKGIWGVNSSDARHQRPEYIGGSTQPVKISEVLNTSDTVNAVQGEMAGHGVSSGETGYLNYTAEEHGFIIQITCVVPKVSYFQGIPSLFMKWDHLDYANPLLADLGPQELPTSEIYYDWNYTQPENQVNFAYKDRYAEYKSIQDSVHAAFRTDFKYWTMARTFAAAPALNTSFVKMVPESDIFAVPDEDNYFMHIYHDVSALLPLPYYANLKID